MARHDREMLPASHEQEVTRALGPAQMIYYATGGLAGGLVFTLMNNALPLFLLGYTMPPGLPAFLNPGGPVPATIVALLTNERSLFGGLVQPFIGAMSDRTHTPMGKRSPYILAGGVGTMLCIVLLALQPTFWLMVLAVTMAGVCLFIALGPYASLMADITPARQRGRLGGLMALAGVVGAVAISVVSSLAWTNARWLVFVVAGAGVAVAMAVVALGVHEGPTGITHHPHHEHNRGMVRDVARQRPLLLYIISMAIYWLGAGAASPFITRFGVKELHIEEDASFSLLLVIVLATAIGAVISGVLADRLGRRRVLLPALVLFAFATFVGSQLQTLLQALPIMLLVGLANAVPTALNIPLLADLVPRRRAGAYMGFANMIWSVAQPAGSLIAGMLVDLTNSYRGVFIMAGVCMLAAAILLHWVPNTHHEQE